MGVPATGDYGLGSGFFYSVRVASLGHALPLTRPLRVTLPRFPRLLVLLRADRPHWCRLRQVPVTCVPGEFKRVGGIPISPALATSMEAQRVTLSA